MMEIIFESHGTTLDNEAGLASGHFDAELSALGMKQAQEMGERYKNESFDTIFTSDMQRAYKTAEIAFAARNIPIIKDKRLRECDYGDLTRRPDSEVEPLKINHIKIPFPNGESYEQAVERVKGFLRSTIPVRQGGGIQKKILIIAHRAPWYALENLVNGRSLEELITTPTSPNKFFRI